MTFVLTYGAVFGLMLAKIPYGSPLCLGVFSLCMLFPALCSILTRLITREGFSDLYLKPHFKGHWRYYLAGLLGPSILIVIGAAVYFLLFPRQFDPNMTALSQSLAAQGIDIGALGSLMIVQLAFGAVAGGIINLPFALGEELGWRGYLLPQLCKNMPAGKAVLLSGIIWGLWHAPMIAMGHNYGVGYPTAPWGGILAMIVFCIVGGTFFSYLALQTKSALPAALGHGALNAFAAAPAYFVAGGVYNPFVGPAATGIIGGVGFIVVAIWCFLQIRKKNAATSPSVEQ
ncbi:MAG: CPBP family glutamic-type intramembrane protease [Oscillospiraceae bacterium]|nr:CPBP family glutamic-type intramembrane protease [Oscillospiraceae bacterium]